MGARSSVLSASRTSRKFSHPNASPDSGAARSPTESVRRCSTAIGAVTADRIGRGRVGRRRRRPRRPGAGLQGFGGNALDPHVGEPRVPEAERHGGRSRNVDDSSMDERPPIDDPDDHGPAVVEIEDPDPRSHRQAAMRRSQPLSAIKRRQAQLRRRGVATHPERDRAENKKCSHPQLASCVSRPLGVRRNGNTKSTNLPAARVSRLGRLKSPRETLERGQTDLIGLKRLSRRLGPQGSRCVSAAPSASRAGVHSPGVDFRHAAGGRRPRG